MNKNNHRYGNNVNNIEELKNNIEEFIDNNLDNNKGGNKSVHIMINNKEGINKIGNNKVSITRQMECTKPSMASTSPTSTSSKHSDRQIPTQRPIRAGSEWDHHCQHQRHRGQHRQGTIEHQHWRKKLNINIDKIESDLNIDIRELSLQIPFWTATFKDHHCSSRSGFLHRYP